MKQDLREPEHVAPSPAVGDDIDLDGHRWSFAGDTVERFDQHVRKSVPGYEDGHALVEHLSDFFVASRGRVIELGCSTGTLISRLAQRHANVDAEFLGVDLVPDMVERARERRSGLRNLQIEVADARRVDFTDASLIIMYYTLQFVPVWQRRSLLARICEEMRPGGGLILFEKTRLADGRMQDICNQIYDAYKLEHGFAAEEILGKTRSLRGVLEPFTYAQNADLIRGAGFDEPYLIYKYLAFEGMLAIRSPLAVSAGDG
jgi:tRNA (cmo5U34)-methyltransferase